uniref:Uncharacterized protein n=2 Tax=Anguilla anguilla TaxID=7936 RepID=A0A0E9SZI1_ANGAN
MNSLVPLLQLGCRSFKCCVKTGHFSFKLMDLLFQLSLFCAYSIKLSLKTLDVLLLGSKFQI